MAEDVKQMWIVIRPDSLLQVLERVESGVPATEVMLQVIDIAHESMEEDDE